MSNQYFSSASDAASFVIELLHNGYFQDFTAEDRVQDPDGVYATCAEITVCDEGEERYFFSGKEREGLILFAEATPAERAELFQIWDK